MKEKERRLERLALVVALTVFFLVFLVFFVLPIARQLLELLAIFNWGEGG